jgi:hypothetical protein
LQCKEGGHQRKRRRERRTWNRAKRGELVVDVTAGQSDGKAAPYDTI